MTELQRLLTETLRKLDKDTTTRFQQLEARIQNLEAELQACQALQNDLEQLLAKLSNWSGGCGKR
ncbi:hypothetical protein [Pseudodesulfovibrio tunisiensis]|uniref:hypothetical protein n=1 Tax=Pseudodesulfovibrio tunisiensis TaxID=463192 RepID=UPI001FB38255|nr:hypothetical protein [Pseudodesulfovibrio tunisiensis]